MSKTHKNSLLSVTGRQALVNSVLIDKLPKVSAAKKFNVSVPTVRKWVKRYVSEGESGLEDLVLRVRIKVRESDLTRNNGEDHHYEEAREVHRRSYHS